MHSAGDDLLSISVADVETAQRLAADLRESGDWIEAVAGVDSVVVRFDIASVQRPEDDNGTARSADPPLRDRRNRQRQLAFQTPRISSAP